MTSSIHSPRITTFAAFAEAVATSGHVLSDDDVQQAAARFAVPPSQVAALRAQALTAHADAADAVRGGVRAQPADARPSALVATGKGVGGQGARFAPDTSAPARAVITSLPAYLDLASMSAFHGVNLGNDTAAAATAVLRDGNGNELHLDFPYRGVPLRKPGVFFRAKDEIGSFEVADIAPPVARALIPMLDEVIAFGARGREHADAGHAVLVCKQMLGYCEGEAFGISDSTASRDLAQVSLAAAAFDKGSTAKARAILEDLTDSPHRDARAQANYVRAVVLKNLGRTAEALTAVRVALPHMTTAKRQALTLRAEIHNARGEFYEGLHVAEAAVKEGLQQRAAGAQVALNSAYFALGFAQKNMGKIDDAIVSMQAALSEKPESTAIKLALAGYFAVAGKAKEAEQMFGAIPVPAADTLAFVDDHTNPTWFYGVAKDSARVVEHAKQALAAAAAQHQPGVAHYFLPLRGRNHQNIPRPKAEEFNSEPDLAWMRADPAFVQLLKGAGAG